MEGETQEARDNSEKICAQNMPDELVFDILTRLPVKSVLRFKCICKSWLSMISHPKFIKTHLHPSTERLLLRTKHQAVVNGAVHWVMYSMKSSSWVIVYFDLAEVKFKEVPRPSSWSEDDEMNLVVLGGFLCVYCDGHVKQIEVYVMKEYGKKESWARLFVMPCAMIRGTFSSIHVKLLCLTKKGQVLILVEERGIGIYDLKDGTYLPCDSVGDPKDGTYLLWDSFRGQQPIPYVESLVSLNGEV